MGISNFFALLTSKENCALRPWSSSFLTTFFLLIIIIHGDTKIDIIADDFNYIAPIMKSWKTSYLSSRKTFCFVLVVLTDNLNIIQHSYT